MNRNSAAVLLLPLVLYADAKAVEWKAVTPPSRCAARMICDSANQRLILFGGTTVYQDGVYFNDVWEMPLDDPDVRCWFPLSPSGTPPVGRADHTMIYDPAGGRAILFGGSPSFGQMLNDVWELDLTPGSESWSRLTTSGTPPSARGYAYPIYYPDRHSLIVFGGYTPSHSLNDLWELQLDSLVWRQVNASNPPSARSDGACAYDRQGNRLIVYGGVFSDETWALDLTAGSERWTRLTPSGDVPSGRSGFAHACTPDGSKLLVFGGWDPGTFYNDLYELDVASTTWKRVSAAGTPPMARRNTSGAFDFNAGNFVIFAGEHSWGAYLGDTYLAEGVGAIGETPGWVPVAGSGISLQVASVSLGPVRLSCAVARECRIQADIIDVDGRLVMRLFSGEATPPGLNFRWDRLDASGCRVPAGTYVFRVESGTSTIAKRFILAE